MMTLDKKFPARLLFNATTRGLGDHSVSFASPMGRRSVSACSGGDFSGPRVSGTVVKDVSSEWRLSSTADPTLFSVEGLVTLQTDAGEVALMKYLGRGSKRYGPNSYRVGVGFEANVGPLQWLNDVQAAAYVEIEGSNLRFAVYELLGQRRVEDATSLDVEPLFTLNTREAIGERLKIDGEVTGRYFTTAKQGCTMTGTLSGEWLKGYSWGPHRISKSETGFPWQIDMRVAMRTEDGIPIIQHYTGTVPREHAAPDPQADRSWRTTAVYETEGEGRMSWLNGIVAVGIGWPENNEVKYLYYILA
jgi:hypothetical protein